MYVSVALVILLANLLDSVLAIQSQLRIDLISKLLNLPGGIRQQHRWLSYPNYTFPVHWAKKPIKAVMGFRKFSLRGLSAATGEWWLVCLAYNLRRLHTVTQG